MISNTHSNWSVKAFHWNISIKTKRKSKQKHHKTTPLKFSKHECPCPGPQSNFNWTIDQLLASCKRSSDEHHTESKNIQSFLNSCFVDLNHIKDIYFFERLTGVLVVGKKHHKSKEVCISMVKGKVKSKNNTYKLRHGRERIFRGRVNWQLGNS